MKIIEFIKNNILILDGGMGTLLQKRGLEPGELPERWNISKPEIIQQIHKAYFDAGSNVVSTNTFGANLLKFSEIELEAIIKAAVNNAKIAKEQTVNKNHKYIALDIGPSGKLLKPYGDLSFEDAVKLFSFTIKIGVKEGVDLIFIETMNDSLETKAALLAAKESCDKPVFVSNAYGQDGKLMTGATPAAMVAMLEGMGADAIGINCSLGPKAMEPIAKEYIENASVPVILKPNAGLPRMEKGETVYDVDKQQFTLEILPLLQKGVSIVGGCCGTTPEYIKELSDKAKDTTPVIPTAKNKTVVSSYTHAVEFGKEPILIGERINPTGKKRFKQALIENDIDYILSEGINQQQAGVHILDVNVGLPEIDEPEMLKNAVYELQAVSDLPLQIDTADPVAMEKALRIYSGKAMVNSVNGKDESMDSIFPLVKKYGGTVVALTLDENGIPDTALGRVEIAKKIIKRAEDYGIDKKDIIFDTLAMTVSANDRAATVTLEALEIIKNQLGCHTSLGVSNISFGLPQRDTVNHIFFACALERGLSAAIMNPYCEDMIKTFYAFNALHGLDSNCSKYIEFSSEQNSEPEQKATEGELCDYIIKGFKDKAAQATKELLKTNQPLDIVQTKIIPALDSVGKGFEKGSVYLPQLLMSAEAAKAAFEQIKERLESTSKAETAGKGKIIIATVKGDIHDIGKNIVKLLIENYGFEVTDLGKDVEPQRILDQVLKTNAKAVALSALMTTTVPAMEQTIALIKEKAPFCKVMVGGAVLTEQYAKKIGADGYSPDAMGAVRLAEQFCL